MKNFKKDLQAVMKELKSLTKRVDKLSAAIDKAIKAKPANKPKAAKKAAPKKAPKPTKPTKAVKATKATKAQKETAADAVFSIIRRSRKGVNTSVLKEKTGFDDKKIQNIVYKLKKQNKIKSERKGIYVKV